MAVEITDTGKTILVKITTPQNGYSPQEHSFNKARTDLNISASEGMFSIESDVKLIRVAYNSVTIPVSVDLPTLRDTVNGYL